MIPFIYKFRKGKTSYSDRKQISGCYKGNGENFWDDGVLYLDVVVVARIDTSFKSH